MDQLNRILDGGYSTNERVLWINRLNYTYSTVVRHPLERVKSHFYFHRSMKTDPNHKWARNRDLADWVGMMEDSKDCSVAHIAGVHAKSWWNEGDGAVGPLLPYRDDKMAVRMDWIVTWDHYLMARRNLIGMGWVGVFERLQESVDQLTHFWGMERTKLRVKNRNGRKPEGALSQEEIDKIIAFNMGDVFLHELALVLFQQQELALKYVNRF